MSYSDEGLKGLENEKVISFENENLAGFRKKVGRFDPKKRVPPLIQKFIAGLFVDTQYFSHMILRNYFHNSFEYTFHIQDALGFVIVM